MPVTPEQAFPLGTNSEKLLVRQWAREVQDSVDTGQAAGFAYTTLALLNADLAHPVNTKAEVYADPTPANNGVYVKVGGSGTGSWTKIASLAVSTKIDKDGSVDFTADQSMGGFKLTDLDDPVADTDAAHKGYIDDTVGDLAAVNLEYSIEQSPVGDTLNVDGHVVQDATVDASDRVMEALFATGGRFSPSTAADTQIWPGIGLISMMSQSKGLGGQGWPIVTTVDTNWGSKMFSRGPRSWDTDDHPADPESRRLGHFDVIPQIAVEDGSWGEGVHNGFMDELKARILGSRFTTALKSGDPLLLMSPGGAAGKQIDELSSADHETNVSQPVLNQGPGGYWATMLDDIERGKDAAEVLGKTIKMLCLLWVQGDSNNDAATGGIFENRWTAALSRSAGISWYAARLIDVYGEWASDVSAALLQNNPVPLIVSQAPAQVGEAQDVAAQLAADIYIDGPEYQLASALNSKLSSDFSWGFSIHWTADDARWKGANMAKVAHRVLTGRDWEHFRPLRAFCNAARTSVYIDFVVPVPPIQFDTDFLMRQSRLATGSNFSSLMGFEVLAGFGGTAQEIVRVEVENATRIRIDLAVALTPAGTYVVDAGNRNNAGQVSTTIASIAAGTAVDGFATTELRHTGNLLAELLPLSGEGAFYVTVTGGAAFATVRHVYYDAGSNTTRLRYENRSLTGTFSVGNTLLLQRPYPYTNVRDSDPDVSLHFFESTAYGARAGAPYPLWNWLVQFRGLPVEGV